MKIGSLDVVNLCVGANEAIKAYIGTGLVWEKSSSGYWGLCFTAEQAGSTVALSKTGSPPAITLQTSTDGETWTPYTIDDVITLSNVGDKVYFAAGDGGNSAFGSSITAYAQFVLSGRVASSGNIMSLLDGASQLTAIPSSYCFTRLFYGCSALTQAPELPATAIAEACYYQMFQSCTSLSSAPALPATTLASGCYFSMFYGCTSLSSAPVLPATTLVTNCYRQMFQNCSALQQVEVACSELGTGYSRGWLGSVSSTGTFRCPTGLGTNETITRNITVCPTNWTVVNTDA